MEQTQQPQPQTENYPVGIPPGVQFVQVDVKFLQALVEYLKKRPYDEVFRFLDVMVNKNPPPMPAQPEYTAQNNISEFVPEGFSTTSPVNDQK